MECSVDYDDEEQLYGAHCLCSLCDPNAYPVVIDPPVLIDNKDQLKLDYSNLLKIYSKEWWDMYNGFNRKRKPYVDEMGNKKNWFSRE